MFCRNPSNIDDKWEVDILKIMNQLSCLKLHQSAGRVNFFGKIRIGKFPKTLFSST